MLVPFISDTADVNDFQQVVNATVVLRNSNTGADSCFRIVVVDDSDILNQQKISQSPLL